MRKSLRHLQRIVYAFGRGLLWLWKSEFSMCLLHSPQGLQRPGGKLQHFWHSWNGQLQLAESRGILWEGRFVTRENLIWSRIPGRLSRLPILGNRARGKAIKECLGTVSALPRN
jgi:hypothetical protein